jgi:hypothetical protein
MFCEGEQGKKKYEIYLRLRVQERREQKNSLYYYFKSNLWWRADEVEGFSELFSLFSIASLSEFQGKIWVHEGILVNALLYSSTETISFPMEWMSSD